MRHSINRHSGGNIRILIPVVYVHLKDVQVYAGLPGIRRPDIATELNIMPYVPEAPIPSIVNNADRRGVVPVKLSAERKTSRGRGRGRGKSYIKPRDSELFRDRSSTKCLLSSLPHFSLDDLETS
jgi:hypothetical protein